MQPALLLQATDPQSRKDTGTPTFLVPRFRRQISRVTVVGKSDNITGHQPVQPCCGTINWSCLASLKGLLDHPAPHHNLASARALVQRMRRSSCKLLQEQHRSGCTLGEYVRMQAHKAGSFKAAYEQCMRLPRVIVSQGVAHQAAALAEAVPRCMAFEALLRLEPAIGSAR